jgi:hypothetical protein
MKLGWPEKVVFWASLFVGAIMLLGWLLLSVGIGWVHDSRLNIAVLHLYLESMLAFVLPLWLILRTIYFISDNRQGRQSRR